MKERDGMETSVRRENIDGEKGYLEVRKINEGEKGMTKGRRRRKGEKGGSDGSERGRHVDTRDILMVSVQVDEKFALIYCLKFVSFYDTDLI